MANSETAEGKMEEGNQQARKMPDKPRMSKVEKFNDEDPPQSKPRPRLRSSVNWSRWSSRFLQTDPRHQLLSYFRNLAATGEPSSSASCYDEEEAEMDRFAASLTSFTSEDSVQSSGMQSSGMQSSGMQSSALQVAGIPIFNKAAVFAIFRPTSRESIRKMMQGDAVGKGLNIKGKSAKKGALSALVPFMQICEDADKGKCRWPPRHGRIRLFYSNKASREIVRDYLETVGDEMAIAVLKARRILSRTEEDDVYTSDQRSSAREKMMWVVDDPLIYVLDSYTPEYWGLDVPERVFFEACINRQDISRPKGCLYETGRASAPPFQDMNFHATRDYDGVGPRPVVFQTVSNPEEALRPQSLVMAYEENKQVRPVASDFDSFVIGTRRITYDLPLPEEQIELLHWLLDNIEEILDTPTEDGWTQRWFQVLKKAALSGFEPKIPRFGFGDPKSYAIIEGAVCKLKENGGVRHGSECFNYFFPQELDDEFLVISDSFPDKAWKYLPLNEVQEMLYQQVLNGFAFPLNPKWILCDPGWYKIYDAMLQSSNPTIIESVNVWFPVESGIRAKIARIHEKHPEGFVPLAHSDAVEKNMEGTEAMDLANFELKSFMKKKRAKLKLKMALLFLAKNQACLRKKAKLQENTDSFERPESRAEENGVVQSQVSNATSSDNGDSTPAVEKQALHSAEREAQTDQEVTVEKNDQNGILRTPTADELATAIDAILHEQPEIVDGNVLYAKLMQNQIGWKVPLRRVTKFFKRSSSMRWSTRALVVEKTGDPVVPDANELAGAMDDILREQPEIDESTAYEKLMQNHNEWKVPQRRASKFFKKTTSARWSKRNLVRETTENIAVLVGTMDRAVPEKISVVRGKDSIGSAITAKTESETVDMPCHVDRVKVPIRDKLSEEDNKRHNPPLQVILVDKEMESRGRENCVCEGCTIS